MSTVLRYAFFLWLSVYLGMFISEANIQYECQKDGVWKLRGYFWKSGVQYICKLP